MPTSRQIRQSHSASEGVVQGPSKHFFLARLGSIDKAKNCRESYRQSSGRCDPEGHERSSFRARFVRQARPSRLTLLPHWGFRGPADGFYLVPIFTIIPLYFIHPNHGSGVLSGSLNSTATTAQGMGDLKPSPTPSRPCAPPQQRNVPPPASLVYQLCQWRRLGKDL